MTFLFRRSFVLACACLLGTSAFAAYPDKPVRLIVPWAPGGSTDAIARAIAQRMGESLGQSVIVDNRSGASGRIGTEAAAKAAPDGYTIAIVELPHAIAPAVAAKLPYDLLKDFTPISMVGTSPLLLFVNGSRYKAGDIKGFLKDGRASATPVTLAHSGNGSISHLSSELLAGASGLKVNAIPYRGSAPALTDVAAEQVAGHFATLASGASLLSAGKISVLMTTGPARLASMPQVPTAREAGLAGMQFNQWWALVAPATTPIEVIERLRKEAIAALEHPATRERLTTLGIELKGSTRDELRGFLRDEVGHWGAVVRKIGLQPE
ncbi:tripartite tricarboxylate transporter substrate binding protein [Acidovorax sp. A1169]|jgi:tripartite-type tricarboxylate transporter receptor subunit TctC|uniref:tripartite tricarboxylate transporter substrate binding protein n=1 Tax=Acidovorax sp. A1169 TaxID=3059524 RepID=UPI002737AED1|nr:tripartite tricarboxylate transporter substrate binding protein [Acidovorax sp. A1169]MDP4076072.1 tripartite tricarboxylate transporter substrate binding protein [Acidovorax sp. A1169]